MSDLSIFIPAYNAEKTLRGVVERIPKTLWGSIQSVWIINDGSSDHTQKIAESLSHNQPKIRVIGFPKNRGYGKAVAEGLKAAKKEKTPWAICLHADGQYAPEKLPDFFEAAQKNHWDILQGSRMAGGGALQGGMPLYKFMAGKILTIIENAVFRLNLTDYHSGYLCYSKRALEKIPFERFSGSFDFDLEMIACARKMGLAIGEIGIPTRYAEEKSYLNPIAYGLRVLGVLWKFSFFKRRYA